jgi:phosphinothricin acetyltransferase
MPLEVGKGIGKQALDLLETKGREMGIRQILASIASRNQQSIIFHIKNGFKECGRFKDVIKKNNTRFDIVWMQKEIL